MSEPVSDTPVTETTEPVELKTLTLEGDYCIQFVEIDPDQFSGKPGPLKINMDSVTVITNDTDSSVLEELIDSKALKIQNKGKKYVKEEVPDPQTVNDNRHLLLYLMRAETAWAYAMEMKGSDDPRVLIHMKKRLAKS
ncbi:signal recognition particle protein, partial [Planoprotostelium fungivorum]